MKHYKLPLFINGKIVHRREKYHFQYIWNKPVEVHISALREGDVKEILSARNHLEDTNIDEIISFLGEVGRKWKKKNYYLRLEAIDLAEKITGYHKKQLERSIDLISESLTEKKLEALVKAELGTKTILETWTRRGDSEIRVFPRGRVLHILAGNVPEVGILSLARGILSKNINILKLSSKDPITPLYFALSFKDIDPTHPVTLTTSAIYWERNSPEGKKLTSSVDAICVWGGKNALQYARSNSRPGQMLLEFGPKRSIQFIDRETLENKKKLREIAKKSAHDLLLHDQRACNSPFVIFTEGDSSLFCKFLSEFLEEENRHLPRGFLDPQLMATISELRQLSIILGDQVIYSSYDWTIIQTNDIDRALNFHAPSSRIIYVVSVPNLENIAKKIVNPSIMVVGFSSVHKMKDMRNLLSKKGVERLTEIGKMSYPQVGFTSGWVYPIPLLVRWVCRDLSEREIKNPPPKLVHKWVRFQ